MSNKLQMRFNRAGFMPNGHREISSLSDVDAGFANKLLSVFAGLSVSDTRPSAKPLSEFLKRSDRDKLKFGDFDDVEQVLKAARRANAGRRDYDASLKGKINPDALPIINLARKPGFQMHDNSVQIDLDADGFFISDADDVPKALISQNPVEVSYSVMVIANEKETLNAILGVLATWMRQFTNRANTRFPAKTRLAGCDIELECSLRDPKALIIEDLSPPISQERIFAAAIQVIVLAPLLTAWLGEPHDAKMEVYFDGVNYGVKDAQLGDA